MILVGAYHVQILAVIGLVVVWLAAYQILALLFAQLARGSLAAWSLSLFGITAIYLRKPNALVRFVQFAFPLAGAAVATYWLTRIQPPPISGLPMFKYSNSTVAAILTLILGAPRLIGAVREMRYPLWGEARFIDRVARGQSTIAFTAVGRTYIRQRFDTAPEEFVRIVRRRQTPLASSGTPS
jgi:hypothetical protein